jgi:hypothetical protein
VNKQIKKLAVDFDNTLFHTSNFPEVGKPTIANKIVWWYVRRKKKTGLDNHPQYFERKEQGVG